MSSRADIENETKIQTKFIFLSWDQYFSYFMLHYPLGINSAVFLLESK